MAQVHQEGLQHTLEVAYGGAQSKAATLYIGLCTGTPAKTATLATITEITGSGYIRQAVTNNVGNVTSAAAGSDDWRMTLASVTFNATGTWTQADCWFVATSSDGSGKLLFSANIPDGPFTLEAGGSLEVTASVQGNA